MSLATWVALGVLGGAGAVLRFVLDEAVSRRAGRAFPFGTLAVNVLGAFVLGVLAGAAVEGDARRLAAVGLLGSFTTFSTWMAQTSELAREGRRGASVANVAVSLALGLLAVWAGELLGGLL